MIKAIYPVVCVESPKQAAAAFSKYLGLTPVFEADWYIHLMNPETQAQIGLVQSEHESVPKKIKNEFKGIITIEPKSITELWEKFRRNS